MIECLREKDIEGFLDFCRKHRGDVDDTFLYEEDLKDFRPSEENPTIIYKDEDGEIRGAVSIFTNSVRREAGNSRFRIFYSEDREVTSYLKLLENLKKSVADSYKVTLFFDSLDKKTKAIVIDLGFKKERESYHYMKQNIENEEIELEDGFHMREYRAEGDQEVWCNLRNAIFTHLKGSEGKMTPDMFQNMGKEECHIPGGILILYHGDKPIGQVRVSEDEEDGIRYAYISTVGIVPQYRGRGLGNKLVKAALNVAVRNQYKTATLTVNGENSGAIRLYEKEGFIKSEGFIGYSCII